MSDTGLLIVYFSRAGQNYVKGTIKELSVGNTEVVARKLQACTQAALFTIVTHPYPEDYTRCTEVAKQELRDNIRPPVRDRVQDMSLYTTILLGYPNWWGTMPMAVHTFLEQYDFRGKRIAPFCTHEGSGLGRSVQDIHRLCPGADVLPGLALPGHAVTSADASLQAWLTSIHIL